MSNFEMMKKRLEFQGGLTQEERMIHDKYETFLYSLNYSYQGCDIQLTQSWDENKIDDTFYRALINPNKLKQDYDDKVLSIDYNTNIDVGDVILWKGTQTHWLIYLKEFTEDGYFRGDIRRCNHKINFKDENGIVNTIWVAVRGPVETSIDSIQKNEIRIDRPNWSLNLLMPLNDKTLKAFDRYSEFLFAGKCWRVEAVNSISMTNILEVNAQEYYINKDTDDVENEVKDGLIITPDDNTSDSQIIGETFIKPKISEIFIAPAEGGTWKVLENCPVCINKIDEKSIEVIWNKTTSGQFTLQWNKDNITTEKIIVVESLF